MREIKFRAKDIHFNKWVYGYYHYLENSKEHCILEYGRHTSTVIDEQTIGQFTGLQDKNGKDIYDGDIVKTTYKEVRDYMGVKYDNEMQFTEKVIWSDDYNGWCLELTNCKLKMYRRFNYCEEVNHIKLLKVEVVGNCWDNPELMEEISNERN